MDRRLELHYKLIEILGSRNVYFQPPENVKLKYPCIIYKWSRENVLRADDYAYNIQRGYTITIITRDPDSEIPGKIALLSKCAFERSYPMNNLYHFVYTLYW